MTLHLQKLPPDWELYTPVMVGWLNDPEVVRYSEQRHKHHTLESQMDYLLNGPSEFYQIYYDNKFVGTVSAYIDKPNRVADVGILIGEKKLWGKGIGFLAWKVMCDLLFKAGARKIEAGCMSINEPMKRICEKYGMTEEGIRIDHFLIDGSSSSMVLYGKFA